MYRKGENVRCWLYVGDPARTIVFTRLITQPGREPSPQFEVGIGKTVRRYPAHQEWMDNITSGEYGKYYQGM